MICQLHCHHLSKETSVHRKGQLAHPPQQKEMRASACGPCWIAEDQVSLTGPDCPLDGEQYVAFKVGHDRNYVQQTQTEREWEREGKDSTLRNKILGQRVNTGTENKARATEIEAKTRLT